MASYNTSGVTSYTDTSSIAGISAASGQNYGSSSSGLMSSPSSGGRNIDADMYAGSKYAPTSNAGTAKAKQSFAAIATSSDDDNNYTPSALAPKFEAAGATLPTAKDPRDRFRNTVASSLYDSDMFKPYVPNPTEEIESYLANTAVEDALKDALGIDDTQRQTYQGIPTQEEPEPTIDMSVLQGALQPEPITVEELPDVITKAGDTLTAIAASVDLPLQAVIDANPQIKNPDMIRPGQKINMPSRSLTGEERTALSDMSDITKAQGKTITSNGSFSLPKLKGAVKGSIDNTKKQAMLEGIVDVEVGTDGPVTESSYSLSNLEGFTGAWRQRSIDAGLLDGNGNATALARQLNSQGALGDTIFDVQYAGRNGNGDLASGDGSTFKGRGLVQITGRRNYQEVQNRLQEQGINIDLINNPELVNDERYALPAAIAYLDYAGMTDSAAEEMSARKLQVIINPDAPVATAEERWESAITALRAEDPVAAAAMEKRNEYEAQRTVGTVVDGMIGPNSESAMRSWLQQEGVTVPANATGMDLVVLVNENS